MTRRVKANSSVAGNEIADYKVKEAVAIGSLTHQQQTATTAGIRQELFLNRTSRQVKNWNRNAWKDLTYIVTDRGPMKS